MCDISVIVALERHGRRHAASDKPETSERLTNSLEQIKHRGPDSQRQWIIHDGRVVPLPSLNIAICENFVTNHTAYSSRPRPFGDQ